MTFRRIAQIVRLLNYRTKSLREARGLEKLLFVNFPEAAGVDWLKGFAVGMAECGTLAPFLADVADVLECAICFIDFAHANPAIVVSGSGLIC